jgi:hypothetical protein
VASAEENDILIHKKYILGEKPPHSKSLLKEMGVKMEKICKCEL